MDAHVKDVVREMSRASDEERITFPEVVKALMEVQVERYHADLVIRPEDLLSFRRRFRRRGSPQGRRRSGRIFG